MEAIQNSLTQEVKLQLLQDLCNSLNETNKSTDKIEKLKDIDPSTQYFLKVTYDSFITFGVTSKTILGYKKKREEFTIQTAIHTSIESLLEDLASRRITGHEAIERILLYIELYPHYQTLILQIIDRDLRIWIWASTINKVYPELIPEFEVALAHPFSEKHFQKGLPFYASHKLDGVRVLTIIDENGNITFKSRAGLEFTCFWKLETALKRLNLRNIVLDGEWCIMNGVQEDFTAIVSEIRRKEHTIEHPRLKLFDIIDLEDFKKGKSEIPFSSRLARLNQTIPNGNEYLEVLTQILVTQQSELDVLTEKSAELGWEGLILRAANSFYEGKRTYNVMKVKHFIDEEFVVQDIYTGTERRLDVNEVMVDITTCSGVVIDVDGVKVEVGTWFNQEQKDSFYKNPSLIIGKTITVQYQSKTEDGSLRIPSFKGIRDYE